MMVRTFIGLQMLCMVGVVGLGGAQVVLYVKGGILTHASDLYVPIVL